LVLGSWFLVLGSWFLVLGSWFLVLGSWLSMNQSFSCQGLTPASEDYVMSPQAPSEGCGWN
jgi:hypothetical protein